MGDELEAIAYARYAWDCPQCGDGNDIDHDPAGETLECFSCDADVSIVETR